MKNREIYKGALRLLAEPDEEARLEDYAIRAPYILGGFFYENSRLDDEYRRVLGLEARNYVHAVYANLDADFPFAERFASAAEYYLSSMLVIEEDNDLSDKFFDMYSVAMTKIVSEIPATSEKIAQMY